MEISKSWTYARSLLLKWGIRILKLSMTDMRNSAQAYSQGWSIGLCGLPYQYSRRPPVRI